ncbi:MAG: hypothetical protein ACTTKS_03120 [Bulleidia sp.]
MNAPTLIVLAVILLFLGLSIRSIWINGATDCSGCGIKGSCNHSCSDLKKDLKRARHELTHK